MIVHDESLPRSFWKLGCVEKLFVGRDGQIRGATVRVVNKKSIKRVAKQTIAIAVPVVESCH